MKRLTDQSVTHVVTEQKPEEDAQPWEEHKAEPEILTGEPDERERPIPDCVQLLVRLEGSSCIRLDSLGGGKIQIAFSDEQAEAAFKLGKYRGKNLIATFIISSGTLRPIRN